MNWTRNGVISLDYEDDLEHAVETISKALEPHGLSLVKADVDAGDSMIFTLEGLPALKPRPVPDGLCELLDDLNVEFDVEQRWMAIDDQRFHAGPPAPEAQS